MWSDFILLTAQVFFFSVAGKFSEILKGKIGNEYKMAMKMANGQKKFEMNLFFVQQKVECVTRERVRKKTNNQCCMDFMVDCQVRNSWVKEQAINRYAILLNLCTMGFSLLV